MRQQFELLFKPTQTLHGWKVEPAAVKKLLSMVLPFKNVRWKVVDCNNGLMLFLPPYTAFAYVQVEEMASLYFNHKHIITKPFEAQLFM